MRLLHLAIYMKLGFGVSVLVDQICKRLKSRGVDCIIGCNASDDSFSDHEIITLGLDPRVITDLIAERKIDAVVAYTTPFFECLPKLAGSVPTYALECGDPTPEFFDRDCEERKVIIANKRKHVYPMVTGVLAISEFIRSDIEWPEAGVMRLGWEHAWHGATPLFEPPPHRRSGEPICLGALARLGAGEARYKGFHLFVELVERLRAADTHIRIAVAGRGHSDEARIFERLGIAASLNLADADRTQFYRDVDIFFSPSLWEGCNLPLMEAQANGALGLALDTGAHPEYTPFVMSSLADVERLIRNCAERPQTLEDLRKTSFDYVTTGFGWDRAADSFLAYILRRK
jgi:glycosyltransferase involved in cell wall biosynthesis